MSSGLSGAEWSAVRQLSDTTNTLIGTFMPLQIGYEMIGETLSELALSQEYMMEFPSDQRAGQREFRVMGILYGDPETPGKMGGERIWGDERILRHMVGPIWDELERMDA